MLPNSRMIPSNNDQRRRSNSMINDKKGLISRLLTTTPSSSIPKEYNQPIYPNNVRPKYESVLGMQENTRPRSSSSTSSINQKSSNSFTKLFRKKEKIIEYSEEDDQPKVRPVNQRLSQRHSKIPLAPPPQHIPRNRAISQPDLQHLLANLPPELNSATKTVASVPLVLEKTERPLSIRKSTGSFSIYSTFGGSDEEHIGSTSDDDDDDFVDATGVSQEEIEKEKQLAEQMLLSKRDEHKNTTDEDLAKSMLNWKRHSGNSKRWSRQELTNEPKIEEIIVADPSKEKLQPITILALREEAEKTLSGKIPDQLPPPQSQELPSPPKMLQALSTEFSKTLDDVWNSKEEYHFELQQHDDSEKNNVKATARKLWNEDESTIAKEKMAEWLGQPKPFESAVLVEYMQYFVFTDMRLDNAFRKLCSKLYFKAEAQQIDRILESFANRYWECNPECIFGSADIVYAVVYSLLLLNTDLHVAQGSHARMTRSEFIRNTMSTVRDQRDHEGHTGYKNKAAINNRNWESELEQNLKDMYLSVKHYQILQPLSEGREKRTSILGSRRAAGIKRSVGSIIRKSGRESMFLPEGSIKSPRRDSFSSNTSSSATSCASPTMVPYSSSLFSSEMPYYKEGVVMKKHLLESENQKARHREWRDCFLEIGGEGELRMYALGDKHLFRNSTADIFNSRASKQIQSYNGQWTLHSQLVGKVMLNHTLSNILPPPGYNRHRPHVFALQQADGGVYLFQVPSSEEAQEWVATCNYWAARGSKEPLPGAVSNMDYGWGSCLNDVIMDLDKGQGYASDVDPDSIVLADWVPPQPTMVSSTLDEREQYKSLQKYLAGLNEEINQHRDMKSKILIKFPSSCNNHIKALNNWEARSKYLLHDIIKYQHYCDALEKSLEKKVVHKEQEKLIFKSSNVDLFDEINQELSLQL